MAVIGNYEEVTGVMKGIEGNAALTNTGKESSAPDVSDHKEGGISILRGERWGRGKIVSVDSILKGAISMGKVHRCFAMDE
jgi:hypothetical protein